jgi:hypothetical protein
MAVPADPCEPDHPIIAKSAVFPELLSQDDLHRYRAEARGPMRAWLSAAVSLAGAFAHRWPDLAQAAITSGAILIILMILY